MIARVAYRSADDSEAGQVDFASCARPRWNLEAMRHSSWELTALAGSGTQIGSFDRGRRLRPERIGSSENTRCVHTAALDVQAGTKQNVDAEATCLQPQCLAHITRKIGVPCVK